MPRSYPQDPSGPSASVFDHASVDRARFDPHRFVDRVETPRNRGATAVIEINARLGELHALGRLGRTHRVSGPQGPHVLLDGKPVLLLCSENYLGLANHPRVRQAAADAAMRWGVGAGSSRLQSGTMTIHRRLEERLAAFMSREAALLFGSGYLAGSGTIAALARPGDVIFSDELNHASLAAGCRQSGADIFVYDHCDVDHLEWCIAHSEGRGALVVSESVFSADGDVAPLPEIVELAHRRRLRTVIDETHAVGALGPEGRGALARSELEDQADVIVGSLGAAFGAYGAFVACDREMARYLISAADTFIFSAAPPPPTVAAALAGLEILQERPEVVRRLAANAAALRGGLEQEGFDVGASLTQILPLAVGDPETAARICEEALARGVFTQAVQPPIVTPQASRVRLSVMAGHNPAELRGAAQTLGTAARAAGFDPRFASAARRATAQAPPADIVDREAGDRESGRPQTSAPRSALFDFEAPEPFRRAA